ncbi:glycosyltransferase family 4 protein [Latilactobacillus fuchuensis]|uniref:Uncharacterized protein n=2 Tax=Latilactobacillus fuchuensis TaxID=164393 RepID=A0A2N9DXC2_9LACO|nr:glycosyltransferase family 4 protein [Latilactobacillus fuchuensis]KRL59040.1 glycosyltransferase group 1 protein [Latilactobacillus fuchuensis DSM 14340 = JCM 11249]SPC39308.1 conserved hypothetical protein [Latilactobacillus fuchuensis]
MRVLHINAGLENGGGLSHIIGLLSQFPKDEVELLTFADGPVAAAAKKKGIKVKIMGKSSRYDFGLLKELVAYINAGDFDLVHTHGARANLFLSLIRNKIKAKWIITVHSDPRLDFMQRGVLGWLFTKLNIRSLKKADGIFAVTQNFKNVLLALGIAENKIRVIYNGIRFQTVVPERQPHDKFEIVIVGRLHPVKGHSILLNAFKEAAIKEAQLTIIGEGELKNDLQKLTSDLKIDQQVNFTGMLTQTEINQYYLKTDLAVLSSLSESFPLVLLEAANYGVPVIATDVGDMRQLIPDDNYGWIVPTQDMIALKTALLEAYANWQTGTLQPIGDRLRVHAQANFSIDNLCQSTIKGYTVFLSTNM